MPLPLKANKDWESSRETFGTRRQQKVHPDDMIWKSAKHLHLRRRFFDANHGLRYNKDVGMVAPDIVAPKPNEQARVIECQVQALPPDQLLARYHELVDKSFEGQVSYTDFFELERIEARLDTEDQYEVGHLDALQDSWQRERNKLISSIERLLARFEATP